jgi:hypothetical protein
MDGEQIWQILTTSVDGNQEAYYDRKTDQLNTSRNNFHHSINLKGH